MTAFSCILPPRHRVEPGGGKKGDEISFAPAVLIAIDDI